MAITTSIVEGSSWAGVLAYGAVSALIVAGLGWLMDTIVKPKLTGPRPMPPQVEGGWARIAPLLLLLAILVIGIGGLHVMTGLRAVIAVMFVVPLVSLAKFGNPTKFRWSPSPGWSCSKAMAAPDG